MVSRFDLHLGSQGGESDLDPQTIEREFPRLPSSSIYLNTGSCGRKAFSVLNAVHNGWERLNDNPTLLTFIDQSIKIQARQLSASLLQIPQELLILTQNTTQGLQLIMQSFLLRAGDELVTTNHEHGSANTIARFLEETRGIVVRRAAVDPFAGSEQHCLNLLNLVSEKTKLVQVSEIDCYTGWRPDLSYLIEALDMLDVPLLVDGAHAPGQGECLPGRFPMWVGSGHKWLGGPNGTGFAYISRELSWRLEPVTLANKYYELKELDETSLTRFECEGTADVVRWLGINAAWNLQQKLGLQRIQKRQAELVCYLRQRLEPLKPRFRTPDPREVPKEQTGMVTFYWEPHRLKTQDLQAELWNAHRIWVQADFISRNPGAGMRISCHFTTQFGELDLLVNALRELVNT